ncbi:nucleotidyltransferase domain-containing protein [uncultured Cohaesibacter sp.]|uniref:nucleotidyltransferase domain-containing protein n=1 Tax=uncultured Cohaesibacter sp. TaxID=1002546 RepID=UPI002AA90416|nr:hypothetical protein [uncultured Cohaesibacter sp.]
MAGSRETLTALTIKMIDFCDALSGVSKSLDSKLDWAITGGANLSLRSGLRSANDVDIICSRKDMPRIIRAISSTGFTNTKSRCGDIRSVFCSKEIDHVKFEIMSDVENLVCNTWVPNTLFLDCIERNVMLDGFSVNLMSVAYEVHINALIGNMALCERFLELEASSKNEIS